MMPFLDISAELNPIMSELTAAIHRVLKSGKFILGDEVRWFESEVENFIGVRHAVGLNSGTDALVIALRTLGIGAGDEVATSPFTFFATAEAILLVGAQPVFVDIDPQTLNLDTRLLRACPKLKAVIPVHLFGLPATMDSVLEFSLQNNVAIVEDCAQAFGAKSFGKYVGSLGTMGCFSFFPSKNLGAIGDGGMLVSNDDKLAEAARKLRVHGSPKRYVHEMVGYTSRLDEIQAAVLRVKLPHVERRNRARALVAQIYSSELGSLPRIQFPGAGDVSHVYHQYTIILPRGFRRSRFQRLLKERGIPTMIYYPTPLNRLPFVRSEFDCPIADDMAGRVISLPIWPEMSAQTQERIIKAFKDSYRLCWEQEKRTEHPETLLLV